MKWSNDHLEIKKRGRKPKNKKPAEKKESKVNPILSAKIFNLNFNQGVKDGKVEKKKAPPKKKAAGGGAKKKPAKKAAQKKTAQKS